MQPLLTALLSFFLSQVALASAYQDAVTVQGHEIQITQAAHDAIADTDLLKIMYQAASGPAFNPRTGEQVGYMLYDIDPGSVYETAGLRDYDIVTEIDGIRLLDPRTAVEILRYVKTVPTFTYTVYRDGIFTRYTVTISNAE